MTQRTSFVRDAAGLVRSFSWYDALVFGLGFVIYVARYFYFKAKGLDLIHVQKMIPPE